nr:hypothetical protein [Tanacetum cinerariifolium]
MDDSLEMTATTATSLDAEQEKGNIFKTQSKATPNEPGSQGTSLGGDPRCQETMGDTVAQTRVLDLETTKTTQALEIDSLKMRVKKLERRKRSGTHGLKRLYKVGLSARVESSKDEGLGEEDASKQGRIADIDANEDIYLQAKEVVDDITLAKALMKIKSAKPKLDKVVIQEPEQGTTTTTPTTITAASSRPKAKGLVIHEQEQAPTPTVSSQQPSQLMLDEELAFRLQAEEERLAREKAQQIEEVNIAWDDAKLFMQFLEKRRKFFAAKRAKEKRDRPPTRSQQRSIMTELVLESSKKAEAEVTESGSKRAGEEHEQENAKKQKIKDDKESAELKQCLEIIPDWSRNYLRKDMYLSEVFGSILLVINEAFNKKLEILKKNIKVRGGLLGLKAFMKLLLLRINVLL